MNLSKQSNLRVLLKSKGMPRYGTGLIIVAIVIFTSFMPVEFSGIPMVTTILCIVVFILLPPIGLIAVVDPKLILKVRKKIFGKKYISSSLTPEKAATTRQKLLHHMDVEKPYTLPDVTLQGLARQLSVSPHHLSRIINEYFKMNFFHFINHYRVAEAKKMLSSGQYKRFNIEYVAYEVGFNSPSTFYAAFKKCEGITPLQFKKRFD